MSCEVGESATSGSFWTFKNIQDQLNQIDNLKGPERTKKIIELERQTAKGAAYLPVWLVRPIAWGQKNINLPKFDGSGHLLLDNLKRLNP